MSGIQITPTAWKSVPKFIRIMVWVWAIGVLIGALVGAVVGLALASSLGGDARAAAVTTAEGPQFTHGMTRGRIVLVDHGWTYWPADAAAPRWQRALDGTWDSSPTTSPTNRSLVAWNTAGGADAEHTITLRTYADYREGKWKVTSGYATKYDPSNTPYDVRTNAVIWFNLTAANRTYWNSPANRALALNRALGRALGLWSPGTPATPSVMTSVATGPTTYDLKLLWILYHDLVI